MSFVILELTCFRISLFVYLSHWRNNSLNLAIHASFWLSFIYTSIYSCLSIYLYLPIILSFNQAIFLSISFLFINLSTYINVFLCISMSACLYNAISFSISISIYLPMYLSIWTYTAIYLSININLSIVLSIYLYLFIYLYIYQKILTERFVYRFQYTKVFLK